MAFLPMFEKRAGPLVDMFADGVARLAESKRNFWEGFREREGREGLAGVYVKPFFICGFFGGSGKNVLRGENDIAWWIICTARKLSYPKTKK